MSEGTRSKAGKREATPATLCIPTTSVSASITSTAITSAPTVLSTSPMPHPRNVGPVTGGVPAKDELRGLSMESEKVSSERLRDLEERHKLLEGELVRLKRQEEVWRREAKSREDMLREELVIRREELVESVRREEVRRKDDSALRREETGTGPEETGTEDSRVGRCNFSPSQSVTPGENNVGANFLSRAEHD